jgi:hypothetical protein
MDPVVMQEINTNDFHIFIRDLSEKLNANVKHIVEDTFNNMVKKEIKKPKKHNKKKKGLTAEEIITNNNKKRSLELIKEDERKIKYFIKKDFDKNKPYKNINKLSSDEGIIKFKFSILEKLWNSKKKDMENILGLYYQLVNINTENDIHQTIIRKIKNNLSKYDINLYMLKELSHMLPPLNIWDKKILRLEDWQIETLTYMKENKSIIVSAPTSSGKSFAGMSSVIFYNTVLYVCPVEPVVYQVGAHFTKMGYRVHYVLPSFEYTSYNDKTNVFVGTPKSIEDFIYKHGNVFDYAVFDEIHNLDKKDDGDMYENLIKLITCNFLALSATIKDINKLKNIFSNITNNKDIKTITYEKRFINQQRWTWKNDKLIELHPLCCIEDNINELLQYNLPFSPKDVAILWECIEEEFNVDSDDSDDDDDLEEYIDTLSPDSYFHIKDQILTLDMSKDYELFLKEKLIELNDKYPENIRNILDNFKNNIHKCENEGMDIVPLLQETKKKDMLPMLIFNTEKDNCINIFKKINDDLRNQEMEHYPYHYLILEKKNELYEEYVTNKDIFTSKIKVTKGTTDPASFIEERVNTFNDNEKNKYILQIQELYDILLDKVKNNDLQYENLLKEYKNFIDNPDFCYQNVFRKHEAFCFTNKEPMTDASIRNIRRKIFKSIGIKLDYYHPIIQLLKRGIGIYIDGMPNEYNWIVQQLLASKEIGIVICDRMLCLGIDLPIRTSCIAEFGKNNNFTKDDYLQMSGRAGRRGFDVKGNIIFWNTDYKRLMRSELPDIKGSNKPLYSSYKVLNKKIQNIDNIFKNFINNERSIEDCVVVKDKDKLNDILQWKLRIYKNGNNVINGLKNIELELFTIVNTHDKQVLIIDRLYDIMYNKDTKDIIDIYKSNKIIQNTRYYVNMLNEFINIAIILYNTIHKHKYMYMKPQLLFIIKNMKVIVNNYGGINYLNL